MLYLLGLKNDILMTIMNVRCKFNVIQKSQIIKQFIDFNDNMTLYYLHRKYCHIVIRLEKGDLFYHVN